MKDNMQLHSVRGIAEMDDRAAETYNAGRFSVATKTELSSGAALGSLRSFDKRANIPIGNNSTSLELTAKGKGKTTLVVDFFRRRGDKRPVARRKLFSNISGRGSKAFDNLLSAAGSVENANGRDVRTRFARIRQLSGDRR